MKNKQKAVYTKPLTGTEPFSIEGKGDFLQSAIQSIWEPNVPKDEQTNCEVERDQ
ncbi:hypothetical protein GN156_04865 [bacterium LRH843]|nr:hypothetical protein [bacterium LRH843]